jgi:hypothetical protein
MVDCDGYEAVRREYRAEPASSDAMLPLPWDSGMSGRSLRQCLLIAEADELGDALRSVAISDTPDVLPT